MIKQPGNFLLAIEILLGVIVAGFFIGIYHRKMNNTLEYRKNILQQANGQNIGCLDEDLGWAFKPEAESKAQTSEYNVIYRTNAEGLRDDELLDQKTDSVFRIVVLGESTVFGQGVRYGFRSTEVIEQSLQDVDVINCGIWGFGLDQAFLLLKKKGFKFKPDLAIIYVTNDLLERCKDFFRFEPKPRFVLDNSKEKIILQDLNFIRNEYSTEIGSLQRKGEEINNKIKNTEPNTYKKDNTNRIFWQIVNKQLAIVRKYREKYNEDDFRRLILLLLQEIQRSCAERKANLLMVYIDINSSNFFIKQCNYLGIDCLDLNDVFKRASKSNKLCFKIDGHYNEFAHRLIGEYTADYIRRIYGLSEKKSYINKFLGKF